LEGFHVFCGEVERSGNVLFGKKNGIAYVTVNRPKVLNALNMATMGRTSAARSIAIKMDSDVRVVIFHRRG